MINLNLFDGRKRWVLQVPEGWNELTGPQLIDVAKILMEYGEYPMERDVLLVHALCGIEKQIMRKIEPGVVCEQLLPLIQWVQKGCDLTKQLIPWVPCNDLRFHGPIEALGNLTVGEFDFAERSLFYWHEEMGSTERLYDFIACIYRPAKKDYDFEKNPDGDCREAFNPNLTPYYSRLLQHEVPIEIACAIAIWYKGCRAHIVERFKDVFNSGKKQEESSVPVEPQYFDLIRAIAKEAIYGNFEQVSNMPLYTALHEMFLAIEESRRQQEQIDAMKGGDDDES